MDKNLEKMLRRANKFYKSKRVDKKSRRQLARQRKAIRQGNY